MKKLKLLGKCILNKEQLVAQEQNVRQGLIDGVELLFEFSQPTKEKILQDLHKKYVQYLDGMFPVLSAEIGWSLDSKHAFDPISKDKKVRVRSRVCVETAIAEMEKLDFIHLNIHLCGDIRRVLPSAKPEYAREKGELLDEFRDYVKGLPDKKITLENVPYLDIPNPPGQFAVFQEVGKLYSDFTQLKVNTTLDIAHAGLAVQEIITKDKQATWSENQVQIESYLGWVSLFFGKEEQAIAQRLQGREGKQGITQEVIHWMKEIKKNGKLRQAHLNNCRFENRLTRGKSVDGWIEGDLNIVEILKALKKYGPRYIVTEVKEPKSDYMKLRENKRIWAMAEQVWQS